MIVGVMTKTTTQRDALTDREVGATIFNTTNGRYEFWNGTLWEPMGSEDVSSGSTYSGTASFQGVAADLTLAATAGPNISSDTSFLAGMMGNILGASLTKTGNYLAGVIGADSITGTQSTHLQKGGVMGIIMDTVTAADGAVVAVVDGDSGVTKANAAFAYRMNNSTAGSGVDYGLDLYAAAHDGFSEAAVLKADVRMSKQVCFLSGAGVPTDGGAGTGAGFAEKGSVYIDRTNGKLYVNSGAGTLASPAWKLVTSA